MYRVTIYNGDTATIIHEPSMDRDDPHLPSCSLVQGCSGEIDSLTFTILPDNPGFDLLHSRTTMISVYSIADEADEFVGRVLTITPQMDESGLISKTVICEDRLGFLCDSVQSYTAEATYKVEDFLGLLLSQHNAQVEPYKQINLGTVTVTTGSGNVTKGLNYQTTLDAISEKLLKSLGGEIRLYSLDGKLYLDYVQELGERSSVTIALGKNIKSISREIDPTNVITRLIPLGASADQAGESSEEKVTISSVNDGCIYLDDEAAIDIYGIVAGTVEWPDVTDPGNLLKKAKAWLEAQTFEERIALSALDLSMIGLDPDAIERYNYYRVICDPIGLDTYMRVVKRTLDVVNPLETTYELGQRSRSVLASTGSAAQQAAEEAAAQAQTQALKTIQTLLADSAYLNQLFVRGGIIANDINAVEISASKYLTGVTIVGDVIQAGTLSAEKLILKGADGLIYELNAQAGNLTATQLTEEQYQNALDGSVLVAHSITADKINVTDLFAQDITATGTIRGVVLEGATGSFTGKVSATELKFEDRLIMMRPAFDGSGWIEVPILYYFENPDNNPDLTAGASFVDNVQFQEDVRVIGRLLCNYTISSGGNITSGNQIGFSGAYGDRNVGLFCRWADGSNHNMVDRSTDGLTTGVGWKGSADYKTVTNVRGQTVKVVNSSGTSTLSDERMKKDWRALDGYDAFFDALNPRAFRYIDGSSGRYHLGFGAQSVEKALADSGLDNTDFGGLIKYAVPLESDDWRGYGEEYGLIYTEFVALLTDQVQKLKKEVHALRQEVQDLKNQIGG